jgi:hypothetical protein
VPLGELGAIGAVDQRDMGIDGLGPATLDRIHRMVDRQLAEGVVEVVVAADDMGHAHVVIVDHHREHIGRRAVGAQQDVVVDLDILHRHAALHGIVDRGLALGGVLSRTV